MLWEGLDEVIIPIVFFGFVGFVVWMAITHNTRRANLRAETQKHLLEKFSSGQELAAFLETGAGREFLKGNIEERESGPKWLGMAQGATVVIFLAIGFLVTSGGGGDEVYMTMPGTILLAIGLGLLAAAGLAWYAGRKRDDDDDRPGDGLPSHPIE